MLTSNGLDISPGIRRQVNLERLGFLEGVRVWRGWWSGMLWEPPPWQGTLLYTCCYILHQTCARGAYTLYIYVHLYTHLITGSDEHKQNNGNYYHEQYYCCYRFCCCHRARTKSKPTSGPCVNRTPNCSKLRGRIFKKGTYNSDFNANPELTMVQRLKLEQWAPSTGA